MATMTSDQTSSGGAAFNDKTARTPDTRHPTPALYRDALIEIRGLRVSFPLEQGTINAVDDVSFVIPRARTVGLVGESGCGKSMTGLSLLQLIPRPGRIAQGELLYRATAGAPAVDIASLPPRGD